jgi:hypothetical protein
MIKIASLMKLHDGYSTENSLKHNLGDGFLCSRNAFFSAIRDWAIDQGMLFSTEASPLWQQYQALPFFSLQDIFEQSVVPYLDNVSVFRNVLKRDPALTLPLQFILDSLKKNYILHESSHYVAYMALNNEKHTDGAPVSDNEWFVTYCLLSECMARIIERFAIFHSDSDFHSVLLQFNCYTKVSTKSQEIYDKAAALATAPQLFYLGLMMALWSNVTPDPIPPETRAYFFDAAFGKAEAQAKESEEMIEFAKMMSSLSPEFREYTTRSYFRLYGCEREFDHALTSSIADSMRLQWISNCFHALVGSLFERVQAKQEQMASEAPALGMARSS